MFDNGFRLQAGPQVGFLNKAKSKTNDTSTEIKENFEPIEFGVAMPWVTYTPRQVLASTRDTMPDSVTSPKAMRKQTTGDFRLDCFICSNTISFCFPYVGRNPGLERGWGS